MSLAQQAIDDFKRVVSNTDEFAKEAVYTKYSDGTDIEVSAIFEDLQYDDIYNEGRSIGDKASVFIDLSFTPTQYDTITVGLEKWNVDSFSINQSGYKLQVSKENVTTRKHTKGRFR